MIRVGAKLANFGPQADTVLESAATLEAAGVDSLWLSDRVVTTLPLAPEYPFTEDGHAPWTDDTPFLEAVTVLGMVAARTQRVEIGVGVLVLPLRSPVLLAKQLSTVDSLSGGRVALGIGAGWMAEEYAAVGVPFTERGARTDEAIAVLRACWTGAPEPFDGRHYQLPAGVRMNPNPTRHIPILAGGMTPAALRRAHAVDGWFGYVYAAQLDISLVRQAMQTIGPDRRAVLRVVGPVDESIRHVAGLAAAGISEVVVDIDWRAADAAEQVARVRDAARYATSATS